MAQAGIFISKAGYQGAKELFDDLKSSDNVRLLLRVKDLIAKAWQGGTTDFDSAYVALYGLSLLGNAEKLLDNQAIPIDRRQPKGSYSNMSRAGTLRVLLDLHLQRFGPGVTFEKTLPSEYAVADVLMFDREVRSKIPYPMAFEKVGLGCVWLEYGIYAREGVKSSELPFLEKASIEGVGEGEEGQYWRDLMERYHVAAMELNFTNK